MNKKLMAKAVKVFVVFFFLFFWYSLIFGTFRTIYDEKARLDAKWDQFNTCCAIKLINTSSGEAKVIPRCVEIGLNDPDSCDVFKNTLFPEHSAYLESFWNTVRTSAITILVLFGVSIIVAMYLEKKNKS